MLNFEQLGLAAPILKALAGEGYTTPTPIQAQSIPHLLEGRDLLGIAQTGTGKTAAFALPILHRLAADRRQPAQRGCRVLVLAPTRELASQIEASFRTYGAGLRLWSTTVFGGVSMHNQVRTMAKGVDILVATPGRLVDHLGQGTIRLDGVETVVLDEVDRMLDMGFVKDVRRILTRLPAARQSLFFSATMPDDIAELAAELLKNPVKVEVTPVATTADRIEQAVIPVEPGNKNAVLAQILRHPSVGRVLVFTRTKHRADKVAHYLGVAGIHAAAIHGNKSQSQRERALAGFRSGHTPVMVATDIAARGIDVDGVTHVINYDMPDTAESYVHRIGRTARAGAEGRALSLCDPTERGSLRDIERLIRRRLWEADATRAHEPIPEMPAFEPTQRPRGERRPTAPRPAGAARPQRRPQQGADRRTEGAPRRHRQS
ncbi:MAG: DEAD/DEAH box helicase [Geminicoccaceae bacterium]